MPTELMLATDCNIRLSRSIMRGEWFKFYEKRNDEMEGRLKLCETGVARLDTQKGVVVGAFNSPLFAAFVGFLLAALVAVYAYAQLGLGR